MKNERGDKLKNKKIIILLFCSFILLFFNYVCIGNEINIKQDISKLDRDRNGKIIKAETVTISDSYFDYKDTQKPSFLKEMDIYEIKYLSDGLEVVGHIIRPKKKGQYPVIIYCRGGNRKLGKVSTESLIFLADLASQGYVIVSSQYRGNDGGEGREEFGGKDVNDVLNLVPLIKSLTFTNANKIAMLGTSRGGMMSYIAIKKGIDIKAATIVGGISDLIQLYNRRLGMRRVTEELIGCDPEECKEQYIKRSALYWPEKIDIPVLILHGEDDWRAEVSQAQKMAEKLKKLDKEYKLITYDDGHSLNNHYQEWTNEMFKWFDEYLN